MTEITIELDDAGRERLRRLAQATGLYEADLLKGAADALLNTWPELHPPLTQAEEVAIQRGVAQLDRGEGAPHEEAMARVKAQYG